MVELIILILLTGVNALLAMAEVAYLSVNKSKVALHAKKGDKRAIRVQKILDNSGTVLATIQIGITFAGFFISIFMAFLLNAIKNIKNDPVAMEKLTQKKESKEKTENK